jgi:endoribonuclease Dicer
LETNLDSEVYTARNSVELSNAVNKPSEPMIYYSMEVIDDLPQQMHQNQKPQQSDGNYYAERQKTINVKLRYTSRTILTTLISSKIKDIDGYKDCLTVADYISSNLGPWCCDRLWKVMLEGARNTHGLFESPSHYANTRNLNSNEVQSMEEAYALCSTPADATDPNINNSKLFTPKAKALIDCLIDLNIKKDGSEEEFRCIVFVERRYTAVAIKLLIDSLTIFKDVIKSDILIGHGDNQNNRGGVRMKFHDQNSVISKFRKGELNLMIATNVAEEGLDIQACNYVIR